jgi:hypothetical protein
MQRIVPVQPMPSQPALCIIARNAAGLPGAALSLRWLVDMADGDISCEMMVTFLPWPATVAWLYSTRMVSLPVRPGLFTTKRQTMVDSFEDAKPL